VHRRPKADRFARGKTPRPGKLRRKARPGFFSAKGLEKEAQRVVSGFFSAKGLEKEAQRVVYATGSMTRAILCP